MLENAEAGDKPIKCALFYRAITGLRSLWENAVGDARKLWS
jgi:hypothetical protein